MSIKNRLASLLPEDGFTSSVFTLLSGTTIALGLAYLAQPILTRIYPPASFGLFEAFLAIVTILIPFASFRYEDALMLPEKDEEASQVLGLSVVLICLGALLSCLLFLVGPAIAAWFETPELAQWLYWVPPVLLATRISKIFELWLTRKKRFMPISIGQTTQAGLIAGVRIGLGFLKSPLGLFAGYLAGHIATMLGYTSLVLRQKSLSLVTAFSWLGMKEALYRFKRFPLFSMPSALLSALITRLPALLLLFFFDQATVGFFGRAYALFATPLSLLGAAISQVFFVEGVEAYRNREMPGFIRKVHAQLILIGLFPTLAIMITGPQVFGFILGKEWVVSGEYLQIVAPWLFWASISSPLTRTFDILEEQRMDLLTSFIMFIIQTIAFIAGGLSGDIYTCLLYVCIGGTVGRLIQLFVILRIARAKIKDTLLDYGSHFLYSIPFLVLIFFVTQQDSALLTTLILVVSGIAYLLVCLPRLHK